MTQTEEVRNSRNVIHDLSLGIINGHLLFVMGALIL